MKADVERALLYVLNKKSSVAFEELYAELEETLGKVRKIEVREVLGDLVRRGLVERVPDYERKRMVFRLRGRG